MELYQQAWPLEGELKNGWGWPDPVLTISFIKKKKHVLRLILKVESVSGSWPQTGKLHVRVSFHQFKDLFERWDGNVVKVDFSQTERTTQF